MIVTGAVPALVTVTVLVVMLPWYTVPKLMLERTTVSSGPLAVTVFVICGAAL